MNRILLICLSLIQLPVFAQKPPIDYSSIDGWPELTPRLISNDGNYVCYTLGTVKTGSDFIIQSTHADWKKRLGRTSGSKFTTDSRYFLYRNKGDSLVVLDLSNDSMGFIPDVQSFAIPEKGNGQWLAYQRKGSAGEVVLRDLTSGRDTGFVDAQYYSLSSSGKVLIVKTAFRPGKTDSTSLIWYSTDNRASATIYSGGNAINFAFDNSERQLVFVGEVKEGKERSYALWYYCLGRREAELVCDRYSPGMSGEEVSPVPSIFMSTLYAPYFALKTPSFGNNDSTIFFGIRRSRLNRKRDSAETERNVTVWSTRSIFPKTSKMIEDERGDRSFVAAIGSYGGADKTIKVLESEKDDLALYMPRPDVARFVVTKELVGDVIGGKRTAIDRYNVYITSVVDGDRKLVAHDLADPFIVVSFTGKYVIWYDLEKSAYFSYNTTTGGTTNITQRIEVPLTNSSDGPGSPPLAGIAGWLPNDTAILINDAHDIWKIDPAGRWLPVNLTGQMAQGKRIIYRYLHFDNNLTPVSLDDSLMISAFDEVTKRSAICKICLRHPENGQMPNLEKEVCYFPTRYLMTLSGLSHPFLPLKSGNGQVYLVRRMDASEYPNLYTTKDFRTYEPVTSLSPQRKFNWYTVELIHWRMLDGKIGEGLLYKPENFDSSKHYPLLVYCYERFSDALHIFLDPELSQGIINVPFFASNGYVVFIPDIFYRAGHVGECAYNAIVSGALYLAKKRWIAADKMGLQGHSFGGFETNYVVTRTHLFAAACSGAGPSDAISLYGSLYGDVSQHHVFENGQFRMGASLWERPDLYIENSPIFNLNKVATPLLIMHNKGDRAVGWSQAVEWFTGLQRLRKKAWLVQYDGESHSLENRSDQLDFTIRMRDFFDHYLKNAPLPGWMNE